MSASSRQAAYQRPAAKNIVKKHKKPSKPKFRRLNENKHKNTPAKLTVFFVGLALLMRLLLSINDSALTVPENIESAQPFAKC
jgi:hypothetical protein